MSGYVQTPMGGKPGTSDIRRPTFSELNMRQVFYHGLDVAAKWQPNTIYLGARSVRLSGEGVLQGPLVSRIPFEAGSPFTARVGFDWYRAGFVRDIPIRGETPVAISPLIELALLDFSYALDTPDRSVSRDYAKGTLRLGIQGTLLRDEFIGLRARAAGSLPLSNTPRITSLDVRLSVPFIRKGNVRAALAMESGVVYIDYEDNQELPNHIRLELEPFVAIAVPVRF